MKQKTIWMAVIAEKSRILFSKAFNNNEESKAAIVGYLQKNFNFDGDDIQEACGWVGDCNLSLELMTFEVDLKDFDGIQLQAGLLIGPPKEKNHYRVVYKIDIAGSDKVEVAEEAWKKMRAEDADDPVLTLIDSNGDLTPLDLYDAHQFMKITPGFVTQRYCKGRDGKYQCLWQEFTAGDDVQYENFQGDVIDPPNYDYQPFNMTLQSDGQIVFAIQEVLRTLDKGGEQSRQFSTEISALRQIISGLTPDKKNI
jgi:hypothetical protein